MQVAVDILILGAGWTSTFLIAFCKERALSYAATTRSGVGSTILFDFDADSEDPAPYKTLPDAKTILITFPINKSGASERLVRLYKSTRAGEAQASFIQLGATSIWGVIHFHQCYLVVLTQSFIGWKTQHLESRAPMVRSTLTIH